MSEPGQAGLVAFLTVVAGIIGNAVRVRMKERRALRIELAKAEHAREKSLIDEYRDQLARLNGERSAMWAELEQHRAERLRQDAAIRELYAKLAHAQSLISHEQKRADQYFEWNEVYRNELAGYRQQKRRGTDPPSSPEASTGDLSGPIAIARSKPRGGR